MYSCILLFQWRVEEEGWSAGRHGQEAGRGEGEDAGGADADAEAAGCSQLTSDQVILQRCEYNSKIF